MGVSKQDWKDWYSNAWSGSDIKAKHDALVQAFDDFVAVIDAEDAAAFLEWSKDFGKLREPVIELNHALSTAVEAIKKLALEGNQRRFANKNAVSVSDEAIERVRGYFRIVDQLDTELVRGLTPDYEAVAASAGAMTNVKSGDLSHKLLSSQLSVKDGYSDADEAAKALAAIDKIGVL
jgi:hypothetical protein